MPSKCFSKFFQHRFLALLVLMVLATATASAFTPGKDGDLTVNTSNFVLNSAVTTASQNAAAGDNRIRQTATSNILGLTVGDLILIYQAQGATINTTNTFQYGAVTNLNGAGRYEIASVTSVPVFTGMGANQRWIGVSTSCGGLANSYNVAEGAIQIIKIPQYNNVTVNAGASIRPNLWNGSTGGIVVMHVNGTLTVNGTITATGRGFRGGVWVNSDAPNGQDQFNTDNVNNGAAKGESIAGVRTERGRGAPANGGGGGSSHNSGGGGGANGGVLANWSIGSPAVTGGQGVMNPGPGNAWLTAWALESPGTWAQNGNAPTNSSGGGRGGYTWSSSLGNPLVNGPGSAIWGNLNGPTDWTGDLRRQVGGLGGRPNNNDPNGRLFFGGGGGAGHSNNNIEGNGGAGGGLILIMANQVAGTGLIVSDGAQGQDGSTVGLPPAGDDPAQDAPGGGGGGGTIVLRANNIANTVTLRANGGRGGNQVFEFPNSATNRETEGPGGGGGGGYIAISGGGTPTRQANGGPAGTTNRGFMSTFPVNGATDGGVGQPNESANFLVMCAGTISGRVFRDNNNNGADNSEPGLAGVPVLITPATGSPFTVFTDANGNYNALVPFGNTTAAVNGAHSSIPNGAVLTTTPSGGTLSQVRNVNSKANFSTNVVGFYEPKPVVTFNETPRRVDNNAVITTEVGTLTTYNYVMTFTNNATLSPDDLAQNLVMTITLPRNVAWLDQVELIGTAFGPGFTGTVNQANGVLTVTFNETLPPSGSGSFTVTVKTTNPNPSFNLVNNAVLNFQNYVGTAQPQLSDNSILSISPLAVTLESFTVTLGPGNLPVITWTTSAELGSAGFEVLRTNPVGALVTTGMVPASGDALSGATYSITDPVPMTPGEVRGYILRELEFSGEYLTYGPVWYPATAGANTSIIDWVGFE